MAGPTPHTPTPEALLLHDISEFGLLSHDRSGRQVLTKPRPNTEASAIFCPLLLAVSDSLSCCSTVRQKKAGLWYLTLEQTCSSFTTPV